MYYFLCFTSCFFAFSTHPGCRSRTPSELVIDFLYFWDVLGCRVGNSRISRVGLSNLLQKLLQTLRTDGTLLLCLEKLQEKLSMKLDITVYQIVPKWLIADNCGDTGSQKKKKTAIQVTWMGHLHSIYLHFPPKDSLSIAMRSSLYKMLFHIFQQISTIKSNV